MSNPPDPPPEQGVIPRPQATITPTTKTDLTPVESYSTRWLNSFWSDTRGLLRKELTVGGIAGASVAIITIIQALINGVSKETVLWPALAFFVALLVFLVINFFRTPAKLDKDRQSEIGGLVEGSKSLNAAHAAEEERLKVGHQAAIAALDERHGRELQALNEKRASEVSTLQAEASALQTELGSLRAELYGLNSFALKLDVDTTQTRARVDDSVVGCHIFIGIRMRFDNGDRDTLTVKGLSLTPYERSDTGDVRELDRGIPSIHYNHFAFFLDDDVGALAARRLFEQLPVEGRKVSPYYWLKADIKIATLKNTDLSKGKHFVRLTMLATNQLPFIVDIDVDWRQAMFGFTPVSISHPHPPRT